MNATRRRTLRDIADLVEAGLVAAERADEVAAAMEDFPAAITPAMLDLIDPNDPADPIALQFVPSPDERLAAPDDCIDPIGDDAKSPVKGIVHRYPDRVLLKPLLSCPIHCRFCFRRDSVGTAQSLLSDAEMTKALSYIRDHPEIWEVIVTGGDPFMLPPPKLAFLMAHLASIPHVAVIRLHSRIPVIDPSRVSAELVAGLDMPPQGPAVYVAVHVNHARELAPAALGALDRLVRAGIPLVSQSVLLKGVNDDVETLAALMRALVKAKVKPYYLHHPDRAPGTAHFRLSIEQGQALMRGLRGRISGLCQPVYVLDIPGGHGKVPVGPVYHGEGTGRVADWQGNLHPVEGEPVIPNQPGH